MHHNAEKCHCRTATKAGARRCASRGRGTDDTDGTEEPELELPEEPTNCCMSGCTNCVWIAYAERLGQVFRDGGRRARETVLSRVSDPSMRAFLLTELRALGGEKKQP
ncbi:oxidoreductase-like domain-containing protein 1 isoform X1 [Bacillus rossius redtenbacheri]|uniref:oxidoreductase-like domain-containing protein 1 isoform X1 n=1 Tax=Bacillus rossius redtenbacheri TaxID=93214 RepID=UPI002FDCFF26